MYSREHQSILLSVCLITSCGGSHLSSPVQPIQQRKPLKSSTQPSNYSAQPSSYTVRELPVAPKGCALGAHSVASGQSEAQDLATLKARGNLASTIDTKVTQIIEIYVEEGSLGGRDFTRELNRRILSEFTSLYMMNSQVNQTFIIDDELYVVVCIDPKDFAHSIRRNRRISKRDRIGISQRLKESFEDDEGESW